MGERRWWSLSTNMLLDDHMLRQLHKSMFSDVWTWAGKYRTTEKNIGCDPSHIGVPMHDLCESAKLWFKEKTFLDEMGCRFHHQIVAIHPFVNGNGRLARFATDLLMRSVGAGPFSWGNGSLVEASQLRATYIAALRAADRGDLKPLVAFVRT